MSDIPETRYARSGDAHIAYQISGSGPRDLVFIPPALAHLDLRWEDPSYARLLRRLGTFARVISLDKRGSGLSDREAALPSPEQQVADILAVMDAAGSERASLLGGLDGGVASILVAVAHPERVDRLITYGTPPRTMRAPAYPWGVTPDELEVLLGLMEDDWGGAAFVQIAAPSVADDQRFLQWFGRFQRSAVGPAAATAWMRALAGADIRAVLGRVTVPTLVLQRADDLIVAPEHGRYLARHIRDAKYVELPGADYLLWVGDTDLLLDEIQEFLTGERTAPEPDRILATVLLTDIADSTRRAAEIGDQHWRKLLGDHNLLATKAIARFRGRTIKSTGDGFLATFDGPARAVQCAFAIRQESRQLGLGIRAGLHTGEVELMGDDIGGIAVHLAARVAANAQTDEVWTSRTVRDLVAGSGLVFSERGDFELKGIPGTWPLYVVA